MHRILALGLFVSVVPAQHPLDLVRPDDAVVVRMDGPAALRMAFLPTSLGSLLAAREAREIWSLLGEPVAKHAGALSEADAGPLLEALLDYRGRITLAVDVVGRRTWDLDGVLVLAPDGETDLAALRDQLAEWLQGWRKTGVVFELDGRELTTYPMPGGIAVTTPILLDDHLVSFLGTRLADSAVERWQSAEPWTPSPDLTASPIAVRLDLEKLLSRDGADWIGTEKLAKGLGFHSLDELRLLARPRGPRVEIELSVAFDGDERGIFAGMLPALTEPPALAGLVPPGHPDWAAGKFDVSMVVEAGLKAVREWDPRLIDESDWTNPCEAFAAMSSDYVLLGSFVREDGDFGAFCLAFELRDARAFDEAFWPTLGETASEHAAALAAGEVVIHEDFVFDMVVVRWRDLVFLHHGQQGEAWFDQLLGRARQRRDRGEELILPKEIERLRRDAGPGFQGCARIDMRHLARVLPGLRVAWGDSLDHYEELLQELTRELVPLLAKYDVAKAYALTAWQKRRWRARLYW